MQPERRLTIPTDSPIINNSTVLLPTRNGDAPFKLTKGTVSGGETDPPPNTLTPDTFYGLVTYWANSPQTSPFILFDGTSVYKWGLYQYEGLGGTGAAYNGIVFGVWIKCTDSRDWQVILSKNYWYAPFWTWKPFELSLDDGLLTCRMDDGTTSGWTHTLSASSPDLRDSQWHHVGVNYVYDQPNSTEKCSLYVDGSKVAEMDLDSPISNNNQIQWSLGDHAAYDGGGVSYRHGFFGKMYQPRLLLYDTIQGHHVLTQVWNTTTVPDE